MNNEILKEDVRLFAEQFELWEQLRGKTFLITGATGLIGSVMIKCLLELNAYKNLGIKIVAVVRNLDKATNVFGEYYPLIVFKQIELNGISLETMDEDVDFIVHLASPTASKFFVEHPVETLRTAIDGTSAVLDYAKTAKIESMVYASSLEVYGSNDKDNLISEDFQGYINPLDSRSSYSMGKRACECLCYSYAKQYGVRVMTARLTQTFGAGINESDNRVFAQFARSVIRKEDVILHTEGNSSKPYCYTTDAISAILYVLLSGEGGVSYNIANKNTYISIRDMANMLRDNFNPDINVEIIKHEDYGYAPETKLHLDTRRLEQLGWKPRYDLKEMFKRLLMYLS